VAGLFQVGTVRLSQGEILAQGAVVDDFARRSQTSVQELKKISKNRAGKSDPIRKQSRNFAHFTLLTGDGRREIFLQT
jgi:hypothetical protein